METGTAALINIAIIPLEIVFIIVLIIGAIILRESVENDKSLFLACSIGFGWFNFMFISINNRSRRTNI